MSSTAIRVLLILATGLPVARAEIAFRDCEDVARVTSRAAEIRLGDDRAFVTHRFELEASPGTTIEFIVPARYKERKLWPFGPGSPWAPLNPPKGPPRLPPLVPSRVEVDGRPVVGEECRWGIRLPPHDRYWPAHSYRISMPHSGRVRLLVEVPVKPRPVRPFRGRWPHTPGLPSRRTYRIPIRTPLGCPGPPQVSVSMGQDEIEPALAPSFFPFPPRVESGRFRWSLTGNVRALEIRYTEFRDAAELVGARIAHPEDWENIWEATYACNLVLDRPDRVPEILRRFERSADQVEPDGTAFDAGRITGTWAEVALLHQLAFAYARLYERTSDPAYAKSVSETLRWLARATSLARYHTHWFEDRILSRIEASNLLTLEFARGERIAPWAGVRWFSLVWREAVCHERSKSD